MQPGPLNPRSLPPGTGVGPWRIVDSRGSGTYGSVYLAEGAAPGASDRVALKLAHHPRNERFFREAELLSRLRHPCVPRLIAHGQWMSPAGQPHPWIAMELLEGIPLYEWTRAFNPSSQQVLRVLAGLAGALAATHAADGVHRDVKGDNVLVRLEDGQPFLLDFGSCTYPGAAPLTQLGFPPGTEPYRSPEAFRFALAILSSPVKVYAPTPAEDVFALGVTAYKLVTGEYPPRAESTDARHHVWRTEGPGPQPARELNPRCGEELSAIISRMLSRQPEDRGSARELAQALEQATRRAGPEANVSLFGEAPPPSVRAVRPVRHWRWRPWLAAASLAGPLAVGAVWALRTHAPEEASGRHAAERVEQPDAGTVAVGDSVLTARESALPPLSASPAIGQELPSMPLPGQTRPGPDGRCPIPPQVPINGGCWLELKVELKNCRGNGYAYKGRCYTPAAALSPPATSAPADSPDGGR
ncbi:MAG TPA: serine/threonine-protein kinase [Myxococcus sp.]|nr:serine/threonine-protein kinase [Myxococcus sp.]